VNIDALVAEKVMGWEVTRPSRPDGIEVIFAREPNGKHHSIKDIPLMTILWNPSTDIRAAWEVVEKAGVFVVNRESMIESKWRAGVYLPPTSPSGWSNRAVYAFADTAPEAICLAALKACDVDIAESG